MAALSPSGNTDHSTLRRQHCGSCTTCIRLYSAEFRLRRKFPLFVFRKGFGHHFGKAPVRRGETFGVYCWHDGKNTSKVRSYVQCMTFWLAKPSEQGTSEASKECGIQPSVFGSVECVWQLQLPTVSPWHCIIDWGSLYEE